MATNGQTSPATVSAAGVQLDAKFDCVLVEPTNPGVNITHYLVGMEMLRTGMLQRGGFKAHDNNTVTLVIKDGVSPVDAVERLKEIVDRLIGAGNIPAPPTV